VVRSAHAHKAKQGEDRKGREEVLEHKTEESEKRDRTSIESKHTAWPAALEQRREREERDGWRERAAARRRVPVIEEGDPAREQQVQTGKVACADTAPQAPAVAMAPRTNQGEAKGVARKG
jgi:hypothetical protein